MSKKKRRSRQKHTVPKPAAKPLGMKTGTAQELTPDQQAAATGRVTELLKALSSPPEAILPLFDRLEIPYEFVRDETEQECLRIKMVDLIAGEERNQAQGSVMNRLQAYKSQQRDAGKSVVLHRENGEIPTPEGLDIPARTE